MTRAEFRSNSRLTLMNLRFTPLLCLLALGLGFALPSLAGSFTSGNIAVLQADASVNNTTASVIELSPSTPGQTPSNTIAIDGVTSPNALRFSGSATSTGYLANSQDGTLLLVTGHNSTSSGVNANTLLPRGVATFDSTGTFNLATTYTGTSNNQTRCATTINNSAFIIGDQGGIYTNGTSSPSPSGNFRGVRAFGGTLYVGQTATGTIQVSTLSAITGGTITGLPGLANNANLQDFYLISSGSNGTAYDVLYVLSATSNTAGTINKYSLVSGSWTANGSYTTTFGGFGLAAMSNGGTGVLFVSTGQGALTANQVLRVTDTTGYNSTININTANNVTLYTAPTGKIIKGVAFAPATAPAITTQPLSQTVISGNTASLSVIASGSAVLSYQWYQGSAGDTSTPVGTNSASFTTPALTSDTN